MAILIYHGLLFKGDFVLYVCKCCASMFVQCSCWQEGSFGTSGPFVGAGNGAQALYRAVSAFSHEPAPSPSLVVLILFVCLFLKLF